MLQMSACIDSKKVAPRVSRDGTAVTLPRLLTVREAADYLRVDRSTVWRWVQAGQIASLKLGGTVRIPAEAVLSKAVWK